MFGLIESKHYVARCQQRCIGGVLTDILLYYGEARICRGGVDGIYFSRDSLSEILSDLGATAFKMCEKFKNTYLIVSADGVLITAARSYRTIH